MGRADIRIKRVPRRTAEGHCQILQESLRDQSELDVSFVGRELASDLSAVSFGFAMQVLVAAAPANGCHIAHPEVVGVSAHGMDGLPEACFNFESPTVKANDVQGVHSQVGAEEDQAPALGMDHPDKTDRLSQRDARANHGCSSAR